MKGGQLKTSYLHVPTSNLLPYITYWIIWPTLITYWANVMKNMAIHCGGFKMKAFFIVCLMWSI